MTDQQLGRDPHRYQPEDQFLQNPVNAPDSEPAQFQSNPMASPATPSNAYEAQTPPTQAQTDTSIPNPEPTPTQPLVDPNAMATLPKPIPDEILFEWESPSRPHKKRQKQYYLTITAMLVLIGVILFFVGQFLPIAVVFAVGFLVYVIEMVPPTMVKHSLSTHGIRVEGTLYYWDELGRFWFTKRHNDILLHLEVERFPYRLTLLLGDVSQDDMAHVLREVLIEEKPPLTPIEKAGAWLEKTFPLESPNTPA